MTKDLSLLEKKLNIKFKNKDLLVQAFVHRSYLNEEPKFRLSHNERLEFLGDAVLELVVTEYLFQKFPQKPEGELTNWRAALVNAKMLSETSAKLGFDDFLLLSRGEANWPPALLTRQSMRPKSARTFETVCFTASSSRMSQA